MDWKDVVRTVAPALAGMFGTPLAGMAVKELADKWLGNPDATEKDVAAAVLNAKPEDLIKLKEVDNNLKTKLLDSGIKLEEIAAGDRANARAMGMQTKDETPKILAALVVVGWIAIQWFLLENIIVSAMRDIVMQMLGTTNAALVIVLSYYFGTSAQSGEKTRALVDIAKNNAS